MPQILVAATLPSPTIASGNNGSGEASQCSARGCGVVEGVTVILAQHLKGTDGRAPVIRIGVASNT